MLHLLLSHLWFPVYSAIAPPMNKDTLLLGFKWSSPSCPCSFPWLFSSCQCSIHLLPWAWSCRISYKHFKIIIIRAAHYSPCHSDYQTGNLRVHPRLTAPPSTFGSPNRVSCNRFLPFVLSIATQTLSFYSSSDFKSLFHSPLRALTSTEDLT